MKKKTLERFFDSTLMHNSQLCKLRDELYEIATKTSDKRVKYIMLGIRAKLYEESKNLINELDIFEGEKL